VPAEAIDGQERLPRKGPEKNNSLTFLTPTPHSPQLPCFQCSIPPYVFPLPTVGSYSWLLTPAFLSILCMVLYLPMFSLPIIFYICTHDEVLTTISSFPLRGSASSEQANYASISLLLWKPPHSFAKKASCKNPPFSFKLPLPSLQKSPPLFLRPWKSCSTLRKF